MARKTEDGLTFDPRHLSADLPDGTRIRGGRVVEGDVLDAARAMNHEITEAASEEMALEMSAHLEAAKNSPAGMSSPEAEGLCTFSPSAPSPAASRTQTTNRNGKTNNLEAAGESNTRARRGPSPVVPDNLRHAAGFLERLLEREVELEERVEELERLASLMAAKLARFYFTCGYCDAVIDVGDLAELTLEAALERRAGALRAHAGVCEAHPARALEARLSEVKHQSAAELLALEELVAKQARDLSAAVARAEAAEESAEQLEAHLADLACLSVG